VALEIAGAAMEGDIGRVLFLGGGGEGAAVDPAVQSTMCLGLCNLARNAENQVAIAAAGGVAAVIGGMGRCEGDARVQQFGCRVLGYLALNNAENVLAIAAAGGVAAVIGGMGRCEGDARVQLYGCCALGIFVANYGKKGIID
jgi:hypothetical protein